MQNSVKIPFWDIRHMKQVLASGNISAKNNLRNELAKKHGFANFREMKDKGLTVKVLKSGISQVTAI